MTVSDLIFQLQECDRPDAEVVLNISEPNDGIYMRSWDIKEVYFNSNDTVRIDAEA